MRSAPDISLLPSLAFSSAPSIAASAGATSATKVCPAAVSATLRVVRLKRRTWRRSSSAAIAWLSAEGDTPRSRAAARNPPPRATVATASSSARLARLIVLLFSSACLHLMSLSDHRAWRMFVRARAHDDEEDRMTFQSHNPATGEFIGSYPEHDEAETN